MLLGFIQIIYATSTSIGQPNSYFSSSLSKKLHNFDFLF